MATYASDSGGGKDFDPVPEGSHLAVCDMFVDLGIQETNYNGQVKQQHKIYLRWQIPGERLEYEKDGQKIEGPMTIGAYYTNSLGEKANLRKVLQGWRGKEFTPEEAAKFDISVVLGKPCTLNVIHKTGNDGKVRAKIDSVGPLIKGLPAPAIEGEPLLYDGGEEDSPVWNKLRPWMHEAIKRQVNQKEAEQRGDDRPMAGAFDADLDDDVPF